MMSTENMLQEKEEEKTHHHWGMYEHTSDSGTERIYKQDQRFIRAADNGKNKNSTKTKRKKGILKSRKQK